VLCSGKGEGLLVLVKHFLTKETVGMPSQSCPILKEQRVWRLFDIADDATNDPRPIAQCVLVGRHYLLTSVVLLLLVKLVSQ
jgi:hypothetical protein